MSQITEITTAAFPRDSYERIADTMPPKNDDGTPGPWNFRRLQASTIKWGMELVEIQAADWECTDEVERPAMVYVLLGGYIEGCSARRDEPGFDAYYEDVAVYAQDVTETDSNPDRFVEVDERDLRYDDLVERATVRALSDAVASR